MGCENGPAPEEAPEPALRSRRPGSAAAAPCRAGGSAARAGRRPAAVPRPRRPEGRRRRHPGGVPRPRRCPRRPPLRPPVARAAARPARGDSVGAAEAVARLDGLTRRLRRECPWDREQDERSIVPHTVEEAYELADAAHAGDDAKLLDELGDVLFQVHFLSLLLEERGAGDLAAVAEHCSQKLIRRHPHVFGEVEADDAATVLRNWDAIKRDEEGREPGAARPLPANLPATIYARKVQRRSAAAGWAQPDAEAALGRVRDQARRLAEPDGDAADLRDERFEAVGELLYAAVGAARELGVDAELALRFAADRRRAEVSPGQSRTGGGGARP